MSEMKPGLAFIIIVLVVVIVAVYGNAKATSIISDAWTARYPYSQSLANVSGGTGSSCQFCHTNSTGGDGWNGYGWDIRKKVRAGYSASAAFGMISSVNSDGDPSGWTGVNGFEIALSTQPGWKVGGNRVFFKNYTAWVPSPPAGILGNMDPPIACADNDRDGYYTTSSCGVVDCNDSDSSVHPGAAEICNDGKDNDCNGLTDAQDPACAPTCTKGDAWSTKYPTSQSLSNVSQGTGKSCQFCHYSSSGGSSWNGYGWAVRQKLLAGKSDDQAFAETESYNSDNDPAASVNVSEISSNTQPGWTLGNMNRIYFKSYTTVGYTSPPSGILGNLDPPTCTDADHDGYSLEGGVCGAVDCNDSDSSIHPNAAEVPYNGIDENCNGMADDDDLDHDGYGIATDCNDSDPYINSSAAEIPNNGIDENCNGMADDTDDLDHDGYGVATDCDDTNPAINPSAAEVPYNGIDENCNGMTDDDDIDHDGYGTATDCNDNSSSIHPNATEIKSDGVDQDCNGYDLTINITKATYSTRSQTLTVEAKSALNASANLQLSGFGPMTWNRGTSKWTISVSGIANPGTATVSGVEGSTSSTVTTVR